MVELPLQLNLDMKKIKPIAAICGLLMLFGTSLSAQIEQDHWMFGASSNLSFKSANLDISSLSEQKSISLAGRLGYALRDNILLGADLRFSYTTLANNSTREIKLGPFARFYFPESLFVGVGYSAINRRIEENEIEENIKGLALSLEAGYPIWVLIERLTIEPTLEYVIGMGDSFKGTHSISFNLGFMLYF